jgi:Transposase IS116/IS110/IS902 family
MQSAKILATNLCPISYGSAISRCSIGFSELCPISLSAVSEARAGKMQAGAWCGCALSIQRLEGSRLRLRQTRRPPLPAARCLAAPAPGSAAGFVGGSKKHKAWKLLRQIPGIGPIRAALLMTVIQTPHRFRTKRQPWTYSGFGIETQSSADHRSRRGAATSQETDLPSRT